MPHCFVPTPILDSILNQSDHPQVAQAIEELNRLRDVQSHLFTHFVAVQKQNQAGVSALTGLLAEPAPPPKKVKSSCP